MGLYHGHNWSNEIHKFENGEWITDIGRIRANYRGYYRGFIQIGMDILMIGGGRDFE